VRKVGFSSEEFVLSVNELALDLLDLALDLSKLARQEGNQVVEPIDLHM
jgi:hypothetical protein